MYFVGLIHMSVFIDQKPKEYGNYKATFMKKNESLSNSSSIVIKRQQELWKWVNEVKKLTSKISVKLTADIQDIYVICFLNIVPDWLCCICKRYNLFQLLQIHTNTYMKFIIWNKC